MKNYFRTYLKKTVAILLTALMLLSCWVWVAPQKAEAANYSAGTYYWRITYYCTDDADDNEMEFWINLYKRGNQGTGSAYSQEVLHVRNSDTGYWKGTGTWTWTGTSTDFPSYVYMRLNRYAGQVSRSYGGKIKLEVGKDTNYGTVSNEASMSKDAKKWDISCQTNALANPTFSETRWTTNPNGQTLSPSTTSVPSATAELRGYDQYGVQLAGSSTYNFSAKCPDANGTGVSTSTSYLNTSGTTALSAQNAAVRMYGKAITDEAVLNGKTSYTMTLTGTFTPQYSVGNAQTNGTKPVVTVNQPAAGNWNYTAQGAGTYKGTIPSTDADGVSGTMSYGTPAGRNSATIGTAASLASGNLYYYWDVNQGAVPSLSADDGTYISREGFEFKYFTTSNSSNTSGTKYYITNTNGTMRIDNNPTYDDGITVTSAQNLYGWWEPTHKTVTFINADGNLLYKNEKQDYDYQAYYGGAYPTYAQGNTFTYGFAGWVNLNTGELITGTSYGNPSALLTNQYIYEDTTYMAYYTAVKVDDGSGHSAYKVKFDYNGDGVINAGEGDILDETDNAYYDKVYRSTNVPTLTGEVFNTRSFYNWVDAGITATRGTVEYNDNGITVTSTDNDCYTSYSPAISVAPGTYHYSFNAADLAGNSFSNSGVEIFFFYYTTQEATGSYSGANSYVFSSPGTCSGTFTVPANRSGLRIRLDANDAGNIVKFSDIRIWREENSYTKDSTAEVDYSNPVWVNMYDGSRLLPNTRMIEEIQSYKVKFDETPVTYSLTLITGSNNGNVQLQSGTNYYANANTGVKEENDTYTWADTITLPNPGNFADGVYDYQFTGWVDSNGTVRQAGYNLAKADGVTAADGIYDDEYVRSDGLNEYIGDTITYRARYTRTAKTYVVNFVDETGTEIAGRSWSGEYLSTLPVSSPADQTKVDTLVENNPLRYTYRFLGWDNTKTSTIENYSASYINNFYITNGVKADATYKPVFEATYHYYVKYQNYDGTLIEWAPAWFTYGETITTGHLPENNGATIATPEQTQVYTYEVDGWATAVGAKLTPGTTTVTGDITYVAQLKQTLQEYDVSFYSEDGTTLIGTVADVPYGSRPKDIGTVPTATKAQTEQFVFTFVGWDDMSTQNVIENTAAADLDVVHGHQSYKAVFNQSKRGYPVSFKVPDAVTYTNTGTVNINATTYKDYSWTDSGINFGPSKLPAYYYGERVTAPSVAPELTNPTQATGYEIVFKGWFTGPNGTGDQLGRGTRIEGESSPTTYYAYFEYVGLQYSVQFFEGVGVAAPFYTLPTVNYGTNATTDAATAASQLDPYYDATNHYTFNKWVLADGTTAAASKLSNVTEALKVYAVYTQAAHTFGGWIATTPATYYAAGVATRTCTVCGCTETRPITRLEDDEAPTGQIIIKDNDGNNYKSTENYSETYDNTNTVYVKGSSVDVQINTADIGLGVKNLYYAVAEDGVYDPTAYSWDTLVAEGNAVKSDIKNAHFTLDGEDGKYYIVYVYAFDNAVTWDMADVVNGEPTVTATDPNELYLSSYKIIFDIDSPEIDVTNADDDNNADKTVFCGGVDVEISDTFLDGVAITKDGTAITVNAIANGTFAQTITEAGIYVVTAYDITGKETTYTFTVQDGHDYDADNDGTVDSVVYTQPRCEVNGFHTYTCVVCGKQDVVYDDPSTALEHIWDEGVVTTQPTCTEEGVKTFTCTLCGETRTEAVPATNHANAYDVEAVAATCTVPGFEAGRYCPDCDTWISGHEVIDALGHDYDADNDGNADVYEHVDATCGVNAYDVIRCVRFDECGESYTVDHSGTALEHNYSASVFYEATCEHYGLMKYECANANCPDKVYYEQIEKTAHEYEWKTVTYPTCCTTGLERSYCKVCGAENPAFPDGREMAMTAHEFGAWKVVTAAKCGVAGLERRECKNFAACGQFETRAIAALEHNWVLTETVVATTEHGGYELWTCSLCGETEHRNITPATAAYTVSVYDEDGTTEIGSVGAIGGDILRASDITVTPLVKTGYTFSKWINMDGSDIAWPVTVSGNMSIKAAYTINTYTVNWSVNGSVAETDTVNYNTVPTYDGATPTKATDARYEYTFAGWSTDASADPADVLTAIPAATANVTYYAIFSKTGVLYTITWKDGEGNVIDTTQAAYETTPVAPLTVPNYSDNAADYTWNGGWTPQVRLVSGNATYTATYTRTPKIATIYYFADAADAADISKAILTQSYAVGETFVLPAGPAKESSEQYNYTFREWLAVDGQSATAPAGTVAYVNNGYKYVASYDEHSINYTVTFKNDDGTVVIDTQTKLFGDEITAPADPTKAVPAEDEGKYYYSFIGWKYRGVTYAASELPTVKDDMTFTAVFEQVYNNFTVIFKSWDGTDTYKTTEMTYGDAISYSGATPYIARTAEYTYEFKGWSDAANSSTALETLGTVGMSDITFYAAFTQTKRSYTVTWNVDGTAVNRTLEYGAAVAYPAGETDVPSLDKAATPYRTYTFIGWSKTEGATAAEYAPDAVLPTVDGNVTYYAVYSSVINQVSATWNNYDDAQLDTKTDNYGFTPVFAGETPVKPTDDGVDGASYTYTFTGWLDRNGKVYAVGASFGRITENMTYTAQFEKTFKTYTVTFKNYNGNVISTKADYNYGASLVVPAENPSKPDANNNHYNFIGWSTDGVNAIDLTAAEVTADVEYTAIFEEVPFETFTITFMNGEDTFKTVTYTTGETVAKPDTDPTKASDAPGGDAEYSYSFIGWSATADGTAETVITDWSAVTATANVSYYAVYEKDVKEYSVTFKNDNGNFIKLVKYGYGKDAAADAPADLTKAQTATTTYVFAGWSATEGGTTLVTDFTVTANATYYAVYTPETRYYNVTFKDADGTVLQYIDNYTYGAALTAPAEPTKAEDNTYTYTFNKWSPELPATVTKNAVYTAQYTAVAKTYDVFFYDSTFAADGTLTTKIDKAYSYKAYTYEATLVQPAAPSIMDTDEFDYTFIGWAVYTDATNTVVTLPETVTAGDSYKAVYTRVTKQYTVTFKSYDASVIGEAQTVNYGTTGIVAPAAPERAQDNTYTYRFDGWTVNGTDVLSAADIAANAVTANVIYTAVFTPVYREYTVTFLKENGTDVIKATGYHYNDAVIVPNAPAKEVLGETWVFSGWKNGETTYSAGYVPNVTADATYTAVYSGGKDNYTVQFIIDGVVVKSGIYKYGDALSAADINTDKAPDTQYVYTFKGWSTTAEDDITEAIPATVSSSANYYAVYDKAEITYTVKWMVDGTAMTPNSSYEYKYNETIKIPDTPTLAGVPGDYHYDFNGWSTEAGNVAKIVTLNNVKVKANATYYAVFTKVVEQYTVSFRYADDANKRVCADEIYNYNASLAAVAHPTKADLVDDANFKKTVYTFAGWSVAADQTVEYATSAALPLVTADVTYYAVFTSEVIPYTPVYTITLMSGAAVFATVKAERNTTPTYSGTPARAFDDAKHYAFAGWTTSANANVSEAVMTLPTALADATYYAVYNGISHNLIHNDALSYQCSKGGKGMDVYNCACGYEKIEQFDAIHSYVLQSEGSHAATYRSNGTEYYVCASCGLTDVRTTERLGMPVTFRVVNEDGAPVSGAVVTVYANGSAIDHSSTNSNGMVTLYVPKDGGEFNVVIDADGYETVNGTIKVNSNGDVTTNFSALKSIYCDCTCHKDTFWAKIFRLLYKILHNMFGATCCECQTYL